MLDTQNYKICQICGKSAKEVNRYEDKQVCFECFNELKKGGGKMSELQDYIGRNSKTIMLKDGESIEAIYREYTIGANKFDPEKETVYYKLETEYGVKTFSSSALGLARLFDIITEGTAIRLTREGEGNKTRYTLEKKEGDLYVEVGGKPEEE